MMPDVSRATWAGPLFATYELPGADSLLGSSLGLPTFVQGTDPVPYSLDVLKSWLAPGDVLPAGPAAPANAPAQPAGFTLFNPFDTAKFKEYGASALVGVLAVGIVLLGLWYLVKG